MKRYVSAGLMGALTAVVACAEDFDPMRNRVFHGSLMRDGVFEASGVPKLKGVKWKFQTGGEVKSSPVVADGVVYVGSWDEHLYALDAVTGRELWRFKCRGKISAPPCVAYGCVFVPSEGGVLYALDPKTGALKWEKAYTKKSPAGAPLPVGGVLVVQQGSPSGARGIGMTIDRAVAFDPVSGDIRWTAEVGCQGYDSLATDGEFILSNSSDLVAGAFDPVTGKKLWTFQCPYYSRGHGGAAIRGDQIITVGTAAGSLHCLNRQGKQLWKALVYPEQESLQNGGVPGYEIFTTPAVTEKAVLVGSNDKTFRAYSLADGKDLWSFSTGGAIHSSPSVASGVVYFGSFDKHLYALDLKSGTLLWEFETGGRVVSSPWPGDGVVFTGSDDGAVYALE